MTNTEPLEALEHLDLDVGPRPPISLNALLSEPLRIQRATRWRRLQADPCEDGFRVPGHAQPYSNMEPSQVLQLLLGQRRELASQIACVFRAALEGDARPGVGVDRLAR